MIKCSKCDTILLDSGWTHPMIKGQQCQECALKSLIWMNNLYYIQHVHDWIDQLSTEELIKYHDEHCNC